MIERKLSDYQIRRIRKFHNLGFSIAEIAREMELPYGRVRYWTERKKRVKEQNEYNKTLYKRKRERLNDK